MTDKELTCLLSLPIVEGQWDSVTTHYQSESLKKAILELPEPDLIIQHLPFPLVSCFLLQSLNTLEEGSSSQGSPQPRAHAAGGARALPAAPRARLAPTVRTAPLQEGRRSSRLPSGLPRRRRSPRSRSSGVSRSKRSPGRSTRSTRAPRARACARCRRQLAPP